MSDINTDFSQFVAAKIADAEKVVADKIAEKVVRSRLAELVQYLQRLPSNARLHMQDFSAMIVEAAENPFCGDGEKAVLRAAVLAHLEAMHSENGIEPYLSATRDVEVAKKCIDRFFAHEPDFENAIDYNSLVAWDLRRAIATFIVLLPDQMPAFARTVLKMFPHLPTGALGSNGLRGLISFYAEKDVDQGASRLVGSEGQAIIRRPIVFPERKIEKAMVRETVSATSSDIARHKGSRESSMGSLGDALNSKSKAVLDRMKDKARETVSPYTLASVN